MAFGLRALVLQFMEDMSAREMECFLRMDFFAREQLQKVQFQVGMRVLTFNRKRVMTLGFEDIDRLGFEDINLIPAQGKY